MSEIDYCVKVLASKTELEPIAELLTAPKGCCLPYERDSRRDHRNHFHKFGDWICDGLRDPSERFPNAIFLLEELDGMGSWSQRKVVRAGSVFRSAFDHRPAQMADWVPLNIFTPFEFEFYNDLPFGSTWDQYLGDAEAQIKLQRAPGEEEKQNR